MNLGAAVWVSLLALAVSVFTFWWVHASGFRPLFTFGTPELFLQPVHPRMGITAKPPDLWSPQFTLLLGVFNAGAQPGEVRDVWIDGQRTDLGTKGKFKVEAATVGGRHWTPLVVPPRESIEMSILIVGPHQWPAESRSITFRLFVAIDRKYRALAAIFKRPTFRVVELGQFTGLLSKADFENPKTIRFWDFRMDATRQPSRAPK